MNEQTPEGRNPLGYERLPRLLKSYAVPSIIAMLVSSLYNIVDQIFIGQGVGYLGNAATNVSFPLTTICMAIALLIGIGSAAGFSLELGADNPDKAARYVGNAVSMQVILGVIYVIIIQTFLPLLLNAFGATPDVMPYAVSYTRITAFGMPLLIVTNGLSNLARADGSPKYSMSCMLLGAIINTILDPVFIFVFEMGVAGAALATVIGQFFSFLMAAAYLRRFSHVTIRREYFVPELAVWREIATLGMSNSLNQVALTLVQIVINNSLTYYGARSVYGSEIALAACGIVMKTNAILLSVIIGLSQGSQPIIGFNFGANQRDRVKEAFRLLLACCMVFAGLIWFLSMFVPQLFISIFTSDPQLADFTRWAIRIYMAVSLLHGIQISCQQTFIALGNAKTSVFLALLRKVILLIPLIYILPYFLADKVFAVFLAEPVADFIAVSTTATLFYRQYKKL